MTIPSEQVEELKNTFGEVSFFEEAGQPYYVFELGLPTGCSPERVKALLCPAGRDGYPSRLFFGSPITCTKRLNWNANGIRIGEQNWHGFSWKVDGALRLSQMVAAHVKALI